MEVIRENPFSAELRWTDLLFYKRTETGKAYKVSKKCRSENETLRRCVRDGKRTAGRAL